MGTSTSGGGPGDATTLLPSWALPGGEAVADPNGDGSSENGGDPPEAGIDTLEGGAGHARPSTNDENNGDEETEGEKPKTNPESPVGRANWASAKRRLGSIASRQGGRSRIAAAGRAYVRARGGARNAARSAVSSRSATTRLGSFLSNVASHGFGPALNALGLGRFAGHDAQVVFAAIVDALAPEGADVEQVAAREAIEQTLAGLFEQYVTPDGSLAALEAMTPEAIRTAIEASIAASIFSRWLGDLERMLEVKAVSAAQAVKLERDVEAYICDTVKLDLQGLDPLAMKWDGADGQAFVDRIYEDAYSILGGRR